MAGSRLRVGRWQPDGRQVRVEDEPQGHDKQKPNTNDNNQVNPRCGNSASEFGRIFSSTAVYSSETSISNSLSLDVMNISETLLLVITAYREQHVFVP